MAWIPYGPNPDYNPKPRDGQRAIDSIAWQPGAFVDDRAECFFAGHAKYEYVGERAHLVCMWDTQYAVRVDMAALEAVCDELAQKTSIAIAQAMRQ